MRKRQLSRTLNFPLLTLYGLGTILGAGIYVLIGKVAAEAGPFAATSFFVALVVAGFTAFSYARLSARYPKAAGEAYYVKEAFHRNWLTALVGYGIIITGVVSCATLARGFAGYFHVFFPINELIVITGLVLVLGLVATWGIMESVMIAALFTLVETFGLIYVVYILRDTIFLNNWQPSDFFPIWDKDIWAGVMLGAFIAFYAFIGFEDIVNVAEEAKNPRRNLPWSIALALIISGILYMLVAVVSTMAAPIEFLSESDAPLSDILIKNGYSGTLITGISLIAVVNGALVQIIMAARVLYGMSGVSLAPAMFGNVHPRTQTPHIATAIITAIVLVLALTTPILTLAKITSFVILLIFALVNGSLFRINRKLPQPHYFEMVMSAIGVFLCLGLIAMQVLLRV